MDVRWKINVGSRTNLTNNKFTVFFTKGEWKSNYKTKAIMQVFITCFRYEFGTLKWADQIGYYD